MITVWTFCLANLSVVRLKLLHVRACMKVVQSFRGYICIQFELGEVARLFLLLQGIRLAQGSYTFSSLSTLMVGPAIFFFSVIQLSL